METVQLRILTIDSPIGPLSLAETDRGLHRIEFGGEEGLRREEALGRFRIVSGAMKYPAAQQLHEYFAGIRKTFNLPLDILGTPFQRRVWKALQAIPYGETCSYRDIGIRIGCPKGARAVGGANGANPIPIIIPCHRVIAADGSLGGYGGGLDIKKTLLALERKYR
ncbi:MAG: methylated-DNA--[protein]-cysteine S-methyltransferase [Clostridia bacterium]|jgi:methylated-DNA-[protein]-cysteine S-methyltransferase